MLNKLHLKPKSFASGQIMPPGSKSIANRVLPMAAFSKGSTEIFNIPNGEDVQLMLKALQTLGITLQEKESSTILQGKPSSSGITGSPVQLNLGNSGTCMRNLAAMLCATEGLYELDGIPRMRERPIKDLIDGLWPLLGDTQIEYMGKQGYPPLKINAKGLKGGETEISGMISSQFITGLLLSLAMADAKSQVRIKDQLVSRPYVDMTLKLLNQFGIKAFEEPALQFQIHPDQGLQTPGQWIIEPDASSASYFWAAGAIAGGACYSERLKQKLYSRRICFL